MKYNFFDKFWSEGLRATSNLGKIGSEAFARRNVLSESREDLSSYLLAGKNETAREPLTDEEIIAESISFIVGGSDTTSSTMTNIFDFITRDDAIQQRLVDEIDTAFPRKWMPTGYLRTAILSICLSSMQSCVRSCACVRPAPQASSE